MLQYFYEYTISKIFRTKNFTIPYDTQKRDENLHLLTIKINSHVSTLEEYDNNTCQDQFTSSQEIDNSQNSNEDYQNIEKEIENDSAEDNQELQKNEMIKNDDNILISPINLEESEDKGFQPDSEILINDDIEQTQSKTEIVIDLQNLLSKYTNLEITEENAQGIMEGLFKGLMGIDPDLKHLSEKIEDDLNN